MKEHRYEVTDVFVPSKGMQIDRVVIGGRREKAVYHWGHKTDPVLSKAMAQKIADSANSVLRANRGG
jgi:hypothetical protein